MSRGPNLSATSFLQEIEDYEKKSTRNVTQWKRGPIMRPRTGLHGGAIFPLGCLVAAIFASTESS
jgi:hypothetical protein